MTASPLRTDRGQRRTGCTCGPTSRAPTEERLDVVLDLATAALQQLPQDPLVNDAMGMGADKA